MSLRLRPRPASEVVAPQASSFLWYRVVAIGFIVLAGGMAFAAWSIVTAHADVIVLSKPEDVSADFSLTVSRHPSTTAVRGDVLSLEENITDTFPVGSESNSPGRLQGRVKISSTFFRSQPLVERTRILSSSGVLFRLKNAVTVPSSGSIEVEVIADADGGNPAEVAGPFTIPGLNEDTQRSFKVAVAQPFILLRDNSQVVTQDEINQAAAKLESRVDAALRTRLDAQAKTSGFTAASEAFVFETLVISATPKVGTKASSFSVTISRRGTGVLYDIDALKIEVARQVAEAVPFGQDLGRVLDGSTKTTVTSVDGKVGVAVLRITSHGTATVSTKAPPLQPDQLAGVTSDAVTQYLQGVNGVASASVRLKPFWSRRLPSDPARISVEIR